MSSRKFESSIESMLELRLSKPICWFLDLSALMLAFSMSHALFVTGEVRFLFYFLISLITQVTTFCFFKLDLMVWRYVGFHDLKRFALWALYVAGLLALLNLGLMHLPIYVPLFNGILAFAGLVSLRVLRRAAYEYQTAFVRPSDTKMTRTLLVGAGVVGVMAATAFRKARHQKLDLVGFIDDNPRKKHSTIQQLPVLGSVAELPDLVKEHEISLVVIAIAKISGKDMRRIVETCKKISVEVRVIPGYSDIFQGNFTVSQLREIKIEDLLRREPIDLDLKSMGKFLQNKRVVVTGAGGSIGSELARQVAKFEPAELILLDISEAALFEIEQELLRDTSVKLVSRVANCTQSKKIQAIFEKHRPEIVLHAAAYKHLSLMEQNPFEAIECNVMGTRVTAEAAGRAGVQTFVLVSTDKAVRPSCTMGASKRLAEWVVSDLNSQFETRYMTVRFGNVLGSSGSVVPIFKKQIAKGGPVTVTDPGMIRYFMTIPEACQLILQAACAGRGGELFVLDMGEPVKILDLAHDMIRLSGFSPGEDIPIVFSGMKSGEKLAEQLYTEDEIAGKTQHPRIYLGKIVAPGKPVSQLLAELGMIEFEQNEALLRRFLFPNPPQT